MKFFKIILFVVFAVAITQFIEFYVHIHRVISAVWIIAILYLYRYFKVSQLESDLDYDSTKNMTIFLVVGAIIVTLGYFLLRPFADVPVFSF